MVSEIKSQSSTEAVDAAATVNIVDVDKLAVRKVVVEVDARVGVDQPVESNRHAVQDSAIHLAVTQAEVVVAGCQLPGPLAHDRAAPAAPFPHDVEIIAGNRPVKSAFDQRVGSALARQKVEYLCVAALIKYGAKRGARGRLLAGDAFVILESIDGLTGCSCIVEPGAKVFGLERPRPVIPYELQANHVLPVGLKEAGVGVD